MFLIKKWGILIKKESESLIITGLEIPRVYYDEREENMGRNYFENPSCNVAFERCIDVLAELIEKYAGKFAMDDLGYDYCVYIGNTPVTLVYLYNNLGDRLKDYC